MTLASSGSRTNDIPLADPAFDELLDSALAPRVRVAPGDQVEAAVVRIGREYVFLDLGARTEGLLSVADVRSEDGVLQTAVGDRLRVYVTTLRDGAAICARRIGGAAREQASDRDTALDSLKEAYEAGMPVEGTVKESVKGGFSVHVMGQRAFCPISQIDDKYCDSPETHVGRTYAFEITRVEEGGRNIVVSRRRLLARDAKERAEQRWQEIRVGETYEGTVASIRPFGAFVDIGGLQGLVHVSEIAFDRVRDPHEVLTEGQTVLVAVKEIDQAKGRVSLSLKALARDPFLDAAAALRPNGIVIGTVTRLAQFGAFVQVAPGVEGLLHISQLGKERRVRTPRDVVAVGDEIAVRVLEIDAENRRISLGLHIEGEDVDWRAELEQSKARPAGRGMGTLGDLLKDKLKK